jgi:hypothetical protein
MRGNETGPACRHESQCREGDIITSSVHLSNHLQAMNLKHWFDERDITFEGHDSIVFGLQALTSAYNLMCKGQDPYEGPSIAQIGTCTRRKH